MTSDTKTADIDVTGLYVDTVGVTPITRDWSSGFDPDGFGDEEQAWTFYESVRLDDGRGYVEGDDEIDPYSDELDGMREGPMMSYAYPLPNYDGDPSEDARKLVDLPLCIVEMDGGTFLALTGGGMDFSWEICEAYMRLGFLPPVHFADLPRLAGFPRDDDHRKVIEACKRSAEVAIGWAQATLDNLNRL
jgi:hypothetical protein